MDENNIDRRRRRFLVAATSAIGGVGAAAVAVPFVLSMNPSQRVKAAGAPVEVDIGRIEPGMMIVAEWRGNPIWIVNRTPEMLATLAKVKDQLQDPASEKSLQPEYCKNETRSIKPNYLIVTGICTHLGCSPTFRKDIAPADLGADWEGGFFCPCHGSKFDLAARVYKSVPAPTNMTIPPHAYINETRILIGEDKVAS